VLQELKEHHALLQKLVEEEVSADVWFRANVIFLGWASTRGYYRKYHYK